MIYFKHNALFFLASLALLHFSSCDNKTLNSGTSNPSLLLNNQIVLNPNETIENSSHIEMIFHKKKVYATWVSVPLDLSKSKIMIAMMDSKGEVLLEPYSIAETSSINAHPSLHIVNDSVVVMWHGTINNNSALFTTSFDNDRHVINSISEEILQYSTGNCSVTLDSVLWYFWTSDENTEDHYALQGVAYLNNSFRKISINHTESIGDLMECYVSNDSIVLIGNTKMGIYKGSFKADALEESYDITFNSLINTPFITQLSARYNIITNKLHVITWKDGVATISEYNSEIFNLINSYEYIKDDIYELSSLHDKNNVSAFTWTNEENHIKSMILNNETNVLYEILSVDSEKSIPSEPQLLFTDSGILYYWRDMRYHLGGNIITRFLPLNEL